MTRRIYTFAFFWMFLPLIPVMVPFFLKLGISMEQFFQLQAIFGIAVAALEVPSGYLSDLWGRAKTIRIGSLISGLGFSGLAFADSYADLVLYEIMIAVALSLVSGADLALLYDNLKATGDSSGGSEVGDTSNSQSRESFSKAVANLMFAKVTGESIAALVASALVLISLDAVLYVHIIVGWMPFLISMSLHEEKFTKMDSHDHKENFVKIMRHIFFNGKFLRLIFLNLILWGLATFIAVWIFQKYWQEDGIQLAYFGLIWASYNLTVGFVGRAVHRLEKAVGAVPIIILLGIFPIVGYFGMSFSAGWAGVACGFFFQISRGLTQVILKDALNWRTPSEFRATVNSLTSLFFRLSFAIIGPAVGYMLDHLTMRVTLMYLGIAFSVFFVSLTIPLISLILKKRVHEIPSS